MDIGKSIVLLSVVSLLAACNAWSESKDHIREASLKTNRQIMESPVDTMETNAKGKVVKTEQEWKKILTDKEYSILREGGTEMPYVNEYWDNKKDGIYYCAACGQPLFSSANKYKSGTGWPSFWKPIKPSAVEEREDNSFFMTRTEIICSRCGSHIGHVFEDGPEPTGLRYCMNSAALDFKAQEEE